MCRQAGFFVRPQPGQAKEALHGAFQARTQEPITDFFGSVHGTRPYWFGHRRELQAMVQLLGAAHIFVTHSAADLHWDDLMRHLPRYQEWLKSITYKQIRIAMENLRDNPH
ncbi:uncharacterized protein N7496_004758 [Penicillium cataractarum]|uniref:Helitron helicase-like domain-containing protein n=1 Tax=Penicillium cataractarum TaxID=2100454 RepID=A0A9W9VE25_9EURO|nr:uncharacterized protein N7496_004758 [Penicillium cataractarum]KAJ5377349.1 hypothetical protein N7496_004758 [Penicillium cataractarum]